MSIKALERHLFPLLPFLQMPGVTEICINKPNEVYVEQYSKFTHHVVEELDKNFLIALASLVSELNDHHFPAPLLAGKLPTGERMQFVLPPACEKGKVVCSIRKHHLRNMRLEDYVLNGAFVNSELETNSDQRLLRERYLDHDIFGFIQLAVQSKKNILISGGTGTGKTTLLNACLKCVPAYERVITVEDTREVIAEHQPNAVHLLFNENDPQITSSNLFKACLRLRPDRIFLSELRGKEVWQYLRAANSGHPGSISTVHADTPEGAITQLVFMMQEVVPTLNEERIREYIKSVVHVVVQLKRDPRPDRFAYVSEIYFADI